MWSTCFFIADLARRAVSDRAATWAFLLAALCPFTANYTVAPLAETLSIFFAAVALDAAVAGFAAVDEGRAPWTSVGLVRGGHLLRHPAASRRRHSSDRARALSAVENVSRSPANVSVSSGPERWCWQISIAPLAALDDPQLAGLPPLHASGSAVGKRSQRVCPRRVGQVGQDLGSRLRLDRRDVLADPGRQSRHQRHSLPCLRQCEAANRKRKRFSTTITRLWSSIPH